MPEQSIRDRYEAAMRLLDDHRPEEALAQLDKALREYPENGWLHFGKGRVYQAGNDLQKALDFFKAAISLQPREGWFHYAQGKTFLTLDQPEAARAALQQAVALAPHKAWFHFELARILREQNEWIPALEALEEAVRLQPDEPLFLWAAGKLYLTQNRLSDACCMFRRATELAPDDAWYWGFLGQALARSGQPAEALEALAEAIRRAPDEAWFYQYQSAAYYKLGDCKAAIAALETATHKAPQEAWFYFRQAQLERECGRLEVADTLTLKALECEPDAEWIYPLRGDVLSELQRPAEAAAAFRRAIELQLPAEKRVYLQENAAAKRQAGPRFLIIGFPKCGTTSLYAALIRHPAIVPVSRKETHYFSASYALGEPWYRAQFLPATAQENGPLSGEATTEYSICPAAAERAQRFDPSLKIIVVLRNPWIRTRSDYAMWARLGLESRAIHEALSSEIADLKSRDEHISGSWSAVSTPRYVEQSLYAQHLRFWLACFPRTQFCFITSESLFRDPTGVIQELFRFLDLPPFSQTEFEQLNAGKITSIDPKVRNMLEEFFQPHIEALETLLQRPFPEWRTRRDANS